MMEPDRHKHVYLSTSCLHGNGAYCRNEHGQAGSKKPGVCKFCEAKCICMCHIDGKVCDVPVEYDDLAAAMWGQP